MKLYVYIINKDLIWPKSTPDSSVIAIVFHFNVILLLLTFGCVPFVGIEITEIVEGYFWNLLLADNSKTII